MPSTNAILQFLSENKDAAASLRSIFTVIGIIVGGAWVYLIFVKYRQKYPRAKISHAVKILHITDAKCFLRLTITIENTSEVLIAPDLLKVGIQKVIPWPDKIINWDQLSGKPLNESDTEFSEKRTGI